ncbi:hypothetical protein DDJ31_31635 [Streptomyces griseoviridis]|uniref:Uncharacterized protein n=1 Tax=Streptomyces griseoviridis TaxID=45398 RepID=A0A6G5SPI1_STRGD|nr:hypothetical protein DDJ31_31635 [Streptomyces griseoviridis]
MQCGRGVVAAAQAVVHGFLGAGEEFGRAAGAVVRQELPRCRRARRADRVDKPLATAQVDDEVGVDGQRRRRLTAFEGDPRQRPVEGVGPVVLGRGAQVVS